MRAALPDSQQTCTSGKGKVCPKKKKSALLWVFSFHAKTSGVMFTDSPPRPGSDPDRNAGTVNRIPATPQAWQQFFLSLDPSPVPPRVTAARPGRPEKPQRRSDAPSPSYTPGASATRASSHITWHFGWVSWYCTAATESKSNKLTEQG